MKSNLTMTEIRVADLYKIDYKNYSPDITRKLIMCEREIRIKKILDTYKKSYDAIHRYSKV